MIRILFTCPGGQTNLNSPSENLVKYINENYSDITIDIFNQTFRPIKNINPDNYDVIWGDMDGNNVPQIALRLSKQYNKPCYIHGEWVPPYRFENGHSLEFNEPTNLTHKSRYIQNIRAMQDADICSLALSNTNGGFEWLSTKGYDFNNKFIRYPASKEYPFYDMKKKHQVATIARVNDGKKRVKDTIKAISKLENKPTYKIIGGKIYDKNVNIECLGAWNNDDKVKLFSESKLAIQHWSGIPPAEAIQQLCPVISYDIPYIKELYGDALIWVENGNVDKLSSTIDYWLTHDNERIKFAKEIKERFMKGEFNVKLEEHRATLVVDKIKSIL